MKILKTLQHILMFVILTTAFVKVNSMGQIFVHMNIASLCHNFDGLQTLLARINMKFKIIGIIETRLNYLRNINKNKWLYNSIYSN